MLKKKLLKKLGLLLSCLIVVEIIILYPKEKPTISLKSEEETGVIYLLDENNYVARLDFMFTATSNKGKIKEIVDVLTINNHNSLKIREGFKAVIPENTKLMNIEIKKDLVNLDFSKEILNVDEKYEEKLKNNFIDENDILTILAENLDKTNIFNNSCIYIDEFLGFTPQEYKVFEKLLVKVKTFSNVYLSIIYSPPIILIFFYLNSHN